MSTLDESAPEGDFDFWEFVSCSKCHLAYIPDTGGPPTIPFWVTECGHVICNNHLRSDHRCAKCGANNVQVAALQREMEPPMSNWFTSVPQAFDALAYSARFQIETLASQVRYYKKKCAHQKGVIERVKPLVQERKDMKGLIEDLRAENDRLRMCMDTSNVPNANGKRQMLSSHRHANGAHANSSPRSVVTPVAPDRLTLPPDQQRPGFHGRQHYSDDGPQPNEVNRPGSRRFTERYAYSGSPGREGRDVLPPKLSHAQMEPVRRSQNQYLFQSTIADNAHIPTEHDTREASVDHRLPFPGHRQGDRRIHDVAAQMPPPPLPPGISNNVRPSQPLQRNAIMPPSTPRHRDIAQSISHRSAGVMATAVRDTAAHSSFRSATPSLQTQRFIPSVPSTPSARDFSASSSHVAGPSSGFNSAMLRGNREPKSRVPSSAARGEQRLPFVPGQRGL